MPGDGAHFDRSPDKLGQAERMIDEGFTVFPLRPNTKLPYANEGVTVATRDKTKLRQWFEQRPNMNYGVSTCDGVVLDVDVKHGQPGLKSLEELAVDGVEFPNTLQVTTPTGGIHIYYYSYTDIGQRGLAPGIDVRATGGYVVGPGSIINGEAYKISNNVEAVLVPDSLLPRLSEPKQRHEDNQTPLCKLDLAKNIRQGIEYLETLPEVPHGKRDDTAYKVACVLKDYALSEAGTFEVMWKYWNHKCTPPLTEEELESVINNSYFYGKSPPGAKTPQADFSDIPPPPKFEDDAADCDEGNKTKPPEKLIEYPSEIYLDEILERNANALVKGILAPGEISIMYGESTAGKSFVALDLAYHVALGRYWHGLKVKQAPVVYFSFEGNEGFRKRMIAAEKCLGAAGEQFGRFVPPLSLAKDLAGKRGVKKVIEAIKEVSADAGRPVGLIVIDTLVRAVAGDNENDAAEMMAFLEKRAAVIAKETGAAVLIIHHTNKEGEQRGSGVLKQGVDTQLRVHHDKETGLRSVYAEKVKDGRDGPLFSFELKEVELGEDPDGDAVTSCIVRQSNLSIMSERDKECQELTLKLMAKSISEGTNLSKSDRARDKYAPKWLKANQGKTDFEIKDFINALGRLMGTKLGIKNEKNKGKLVKRYYLLPDKAPPTHTPTHPDADTSDT